MDKSKHKAFKSNLTPPAAASHLRAVPAAAEQLAPALSTAASLAGVAEAPAAPGRSSLSDRLDSAGEALSKGNLLDLGSRYTVEAAQAAKLPLRVFKVAELTVHPYNVRPESANVDIAAFAAQLRREGQHDPIHVVPYKGGFAIMEGQRRWLAAPGAGLDTLEAWVHPAPTDPFEVYAFGQLIHSSRKETTALDQAAVWGRMIADQIFAGPADPARRLQLDESRVSRSLAILRVAREVMDEIRIAPMRFTAMHLYAIAQLQEKAGSEVALGAARSVNAAPRDKPIAARKLDALVASYEDTGDAPRRGRRPNSVPISVRAGNGEALGNLKLYIDGRLDSKPVGPLTTPVAEKIADACRSAIATVLENAAKASSAS